jgi:hypothetical protein
LYLKEGKIVGLGVAPKTSGAWACCDTVLHHPRKKREKQTEKKKKKKLKVTKKKRKKRRISISYKFLRKEIRKTLTTICSKLKKKEKF